MHGTTPMELNAHTWVPRYVGPQVRKNMWVNLQMGVVRRVPATRSSPTRV